MIQHTLQWARDYFEGEFKQSGEDVNSYLSNPNYVESLAGQQNSKVETALAIRKTLVDERALVFDLNDTCADAKMRNHFDNGIGCSIPESNLRHGLVFVSCIVSW
jgi:ubiquitin-activating enzyme E1